MFRCRTQKEGEAVKEFVTDPKLGSQYCEYGTLTGSFIKDPTVRDVIIKKNNK